MVYVVFHHIVAGHECCALSASPSSASWHDSCRAAWQMQTRTMTGVVVSDTWHVVDVHDVVRHMPCCETRAACTAGVRCFLQLELRNLREEIGHACGPLEQRA